MRHVLDIYKRKKKKRKKLPGRIIIEYACFIRIYEIIKITWDSMRFLVLIELLRRLSSFNV